MLEVASLDPTAVYARLETHADGLTGAEATSRLARHGPNVLARDESPSISALLWRAAVNPLVLLLAALATVSFTTGDARSGIVMVLMIALSVGLKLYQEAKAGNAPRR